MTQLKLPAEKPGTLHLRPEPSAGSRNSRGEKIKTTGH